MKSNKRRLSLAVLAAFFVVAGISRPVAAQERNDARFVDQHVPEHMHAGETREATITLKNTGSSTWTKEEHFKLTTQNPQDNKIWVGETRVDLEPSDAVRPGETKTFRFKITAPREPGRYDFQWKMIHESHHPHRFGELTPNVTIEVGRR